MPSQIVHIADTFGNPLEVGVALKLFLMKFKDRDAYHSTDADFKLRHYRSPRCITLKLDGAGRRP
jgi:hypothetical protein